MKGDCLGLPGAVLELLGAEARNMNSFSGKNLPLVSKNLLFSKIIDKSILMFLDRTGIWNKTQDGHSLGDPQLL